MSRKNPFHNDIAKAVINIISQYPLLYDRKHIDYKNRNRKLDVWREICNLVSRELGIHTSPGGLEKRWHGWKSTFIAEHRRLRTPPVDPSIKKWYLYSSMMFLEPYITHHRKVLDLDGSDCPVVNMPKLELPEHSRRQLQAVRRARHCTSLVQPTSLFSEAQDHIAAARMEKSDRTDSNNSFAISLVVGNYNTHTMGIPEVPHQSDNSAIVERYRQLEYPDTSIVSASSFFKEDGKDKCKCIIEERLQHIPPEHRTSCLIEIFQIIQKYEINR